MPVRDEIEKKIEKKRDECTYFERQLAEAKTYLQALQDVLKLHSKEDANGNSDKSLRAGSDIARIREMILREGKEVQITAMLLELGKDDTKPARNSLAGSLGAYARKGRVFKRGGQPNTFTLIELESKAVTETISPSFGVVSRRA